jgi:Ni,Fe-hydrogenase III large subunit
MPSLAEVIGRNQRVAGCRPWPRAIVREDDWRLAGIQIADGRWTLLGLWGEPAAAHMAIFAPGSGNIGILTYETADGHFPSIAALHGPALRLERALRDLTGLTPVDSPDERPWLDHDRWGLRHPLGAASTPDAPLPPYEFLASEGEGLHEIPVGPVHAGVIEPGHFRFTANGETVVRLEERLGYVHKGVESLLSGASLERGLQLAGRVSGDSTVAYALAYARAVESATASETPARAVHLRALMAELERLANHFGDIGAICNDAAFSLMLAHCGALREQTLRVADACFGHRLMMDRVSLGGVAADLDRDGADALRDYVKATRPAFAQLVGLYDNTASLQDRTVGTGFVSGEYVRQFGAGGYVGRAAGRAFDARRVPGYPPYDGLVFEPPLLEEGDVNARVRVRIREVEQSLLLIEQLVDRLPEGPIAAPLNGLGEAGPWEGAALVESFRGDVLVWLRIGPDRTVERCHMRDPSWFQWPLLEAAIEGNIVADFPLCNKSFNCSYSGHDL